MGILRFIRRLLDGILPNNIFEKLQKDPPLGTARLCQFGHTVFSGNNVCRYGHHPA